MSEDGARSGRLKKLSFRAWRRGFKEADIVLGHFADTRLESMTDNELDLFEYLIEAPDQDLYGWIIGRDEAPLAYRSQILNEISEFYKTVHKYTQT